MQDTKATVSVGGTAAGNLNKFNLLGLRTFRSKVDDSGLDNISSERVEIDPFEPYYGQLNIIEPPYRFLSLYRLYEDSDLLRDCVTAYQQNIHGFGYRLNFLGDDATQRDSPQAQLEYKNLTGFFDEPNNDHMFSTIIMDVRRDYEILGQGAIEAVRFRTGGLSACYYLPMIDIRLTVLEDDPITITTSLFREGRLRRVNVKRRFRKFVQILSDGWTLKWFKEFGDPRIMDATTGEYVASRRQAKEIATEVLLFQQPTGGRTYGLPRWIASVTDIKGRAEAQYVNYDILNSQGIPPMMLLVQNGVLTDESMRGLQEWAESLRGPENFNRVAVLQAIPELGGLDDKGTVQIKLENLTAYRNSDLMFNDYLKNTDKTIRQAFRLPSMYLGDMDEGASYASSYIIQRITESQVFVPEQSVFDQIINHQLVRGELKSSLWEYVSLGPKIVSTDELRLSLKEFVAAGAISINTAIGLLNEMFGLSISKINEKYADIPVALLKIQANNQSFTIPEITTNPGALPVPKAMPGQSGAPVTTGAPNVPPIQQPTQKKATEIDPTDISS